MSALMRNITQSMFQLQLNSSRVLIVPSRNSNRGPPQPKLKNPYWFSRDQRVLHNDGLTKDNQQFLKEVVADRYEPPFVKRSDDLQQPLKDRLIRDDFVAPQGEWNPYVRRSGLICRKIGVMPLWTKKAEKVMTTMLQVSENYVVNYSPPGEYEPATKPKALKYEKYGLLLMGSEYVDPTTCTKEYWGLFEKAGLMPARYLARFFVHPTAALKPGTPLTASHFRVGQVVDVRGNTIDRGFQGVMKRHGFKGMPASHGVTKTHRRGGNIGGGGEKGRVWPGTKMPGHMGNRWRFARGVRILRINTKYNVLFVTGQAIPGETNSFCTVHDTQLPLKRPKEPLPFPTDSTEPTEDDLWADDMHDFKNPSITFIEPE